MILHKSPIWVYNLIIVTSVIIGMIYVYLSLKKDKCEYNKSDKIDNNINN